MESRGPKTRDHRRRFAALIALISVCTFASGLGGILGSDRVLASSPARAGASGNGTGGRTVTVSVGEQLGNEVVTVSWAGFNPTQPSGLYRVLIVQCRAEPVSMSDCFTATAYPDLANGTVVNTVTGSDGTGSARFEIRPASRLPLLACSASRPCSIMVYENDGQEIPAGGLPANRANVGVSFAPSQADCPKVTDFDVRVDGSASAATLFYAWAARLCIGDSPVVLDYTENSSTSGRENFLNGITDMGITALPVTEDELATHPEHRDFSYVPLSATAMVIAYNFTDPFTGQPVDGVVLSPRLVARVVTNSSLETFFEDRELQRLNPGIRFPTGTLARPLLRAERNAGATIVTNWFANDPDARLFLSGNDPYRIPINSDFAGYPYPQDRFETVSPDPAYLPRQGQAAVSLRLIYGVTPTGNSREDTSVTGVLGIVDLPTARRFGLKVAGIVMPDGTVVNPTDEAIARGIADMEVSPSGVLTSDPTPDDFAAYPMVRLDYAMVPKEFGTEAKVDKVRTVLDYALGEGQTNLPSGYFAIPDALRAQASAAVAGIGIPATTTSTLAPPITVRRGGSGGGRSTTVPPTITTTSTTTTTTTTLPPTTTSTSVAPISVPEAEVDSRVGGGSSGPTPGSKMLVGMAGVSLAAILGMNPTNRIRRRKRR